MEANGRSAFLEIADEQRGPQWRLAHAPAGARGANLMASIHDGQLSQHGLSQHGLSQNGYGLGW